MCLNDGKVSTWLTNQNIGGTIEGNILSPNMIFPKVLILTLFIFGPFAKGTIEDMEERFEVLERKLAAYEKKDIETNKVIERKFAALTKACEMEDIDLLNTEDIAINRGWISDLNSLVSFTAYFDI